MGGAVVKDEIYEIMLDEADNPIELFHGYTYSGHPIAAAAGLAHLKYIRKKTYLKGHQNFLLIWKKLRIL